MKELQEKSLAMELIEEAKKNSKRWFTIAVIELVVIAAIIGVFVWYVNQPVVQEETTEYTQDADTSGENSSITQNIGE
jgi:flagellar basal body-associated protein FliL